MIVIYHNNCYDGFTSAWLAWRKHGTKATYLPANHGQTPPDVSGEDVLMFDFCYGPEDMEKMHSQAKSLVVRDHHKSAMDRCGHLPYCHFDMDKSGAGLAMHYFEEADQGARLVAQYVQDRDLWKFEMPYAEEIQAAIYSWPYDFEFWNARVDGLDVQALRQEGAALLRLDTKFVAEISDQAYTAELIEGVPVPVVNVYVDRVSKVLNKLCVDYNAPYSVGWWLDKTQTYRYSLRSVAPDGEDVSAIAATFGGGGHKHAAGFASKEKLI